MIGPISGEISMAPMITAVELMLSPRDAISMAKTKTQRLGPMNEMPSFIRFSTSLLLVRKPFTEKYFCTSPQIFDPFSIRCFQINIDSVKIIIIISHCCFP